MKNENLVSIITPSYNTEKFVLETIESVLFQTYTNWEMIIVDDCSTDKSCEVIETFIEQNKNRINERIRLIKNDVNNGAAYCRNKAIAEARGEWIAFLDSDDLWHPAKLEKQIAFMKKNNSLFSYTNYFEIDEQSIPNGKKVSGPIKIDKKGMLRYCWPGCLTVMYNCKQLGKIQIGNIKKNNDYLMWLQLVERGDCFLLDEYLASYRRRSGSISSNGYMQLIQWHYILFKEYLQYNKIYSVFCVLRNIVWGVYKKIYYVKI